MSASTIAIPANRFEADARVTKAARLICTLLSEPELAAVGRPDPAAVAAMGRRARLALARRASAFMGVRVNAPSPETMKVVAAGLRRIYEGSMAF